MGDVFWTPFVSVGLGSSHLTTTTGGGELDETACLRQVFSPLRLRCDCVFFFSSFCRPLARSPILTLCASRPFCASCLTHSLAFALLAAIAVAVVVAAAVARIAHGWPLAAQGEGAWRRSRGTAGPRVAGRPGRRGKIPAPTRTRLLQASGARIAGALDCSGSNHVASQQKQQA